MRAGVSQDIIRLWQVPGLSGLELLHACYTRQTFGPHFHDGFVVGVIEAGALGYRYLNQDLVAAAGEINLALPGEVHNGFAVSKSGWRYRMFYFGPGQLENLVSSCRSRDGAGIRLRQGKIKDRDLARKLLFLHRSLENTDRPLVEHESGLVMVMTEMLKRHAESAPPEHVAGREPSAIRRIKDHIQANYEDNISLTDLSRIAGLSRYHLLRVFKKSTGLTPHAYLLQVRINRARGLLNKGMPIAETAFATGFSDQSHLNRVFKRIHGVTPGLYRNIVQDRLAVS